MDAMNGKYLIRRTHTVAQYSTNDVSMPGVTVNSYKSFASFARVSRGIACFISR